MSSLSPAESTATSVPNAHVLRERFRLPAEFASAPTTIEPGTQPPQGFFTLQSGHIAFGSTTSDTSAVAQHAPSVLPRTIDEPLTYDPDEVVRLLREESYIDNELPDRNGHDAQALVRRAYYFVRPLLSTKVRRIAQRRALAGWRDIAHPMWPVDTTVEAVHREALAASMAAAGVNKAPIVWYWPDGYHGAISMTHDVEEAAGLAFCPEMARLDESFGFKSSFQVVPESRYDIDALVLDEIRSHGCEISLHGLSHDGNLFSSYEEFTKRLPKIQEYARRFGAVGFRSPVMYRNPEWIAELGLSYDMSMPNVGHLDPQHGGCCTVFPYFLGDVVELPTTCTQDYTLFNILNRFDLELWNEQLDIIAAENGLANFIIHPDYVLDGDGLNAYKSLLAELDRRAGQDKLWKAPPKELAEWWNLRSNLELKSAGPGTGDWTIVGPGAERASVAWAVLDGDSITIEAPER